LGRSWGSGSQSFAAKGSGGRGQKGADRRKNEPRIATTRGRIGLDPAEQIRSRAEAGLK
jgi:hypothetical protein